jgi:hypothetical protein
VSSCLFRRLDGKRDQQHVCRTWERSECAKSPQEIRIRAASLAHATHARAQVQVHGVQAQVQQSVPDDESRRASRAQACPVRWTPRWQPSGCVDAPSRGCYIDLCTDASAWPSAPNPDLRHGRCHPLLQRKGCDRLANLPDRGGPRGECGVRGSARRRRKRHRRGPKRYRSRRSGACCAACPTSSSASSDGRGRSSFGEPETYARWGGLAAHGAASPIDGRAIG